MIYALGFNLLLGYTGLPSFGHGAYFGVGAYAFGLFQHHVAVSLMGLGMASRRCSRPPQPAALVGPVPVPPARHLLSRS